MNFKITMQSWLILQCPTINNKRSNWIKTFSLNYWTGKSLTKLWTIFSTRIKQLLKSGKKTWKTTKDGCLPTRRKTISPASRSQPIRNRITLLLSQRWITIRFKFLIKPSRRVKKPKALDKIKARIWQKPWKCSFLTLTSWPISELMKSPAMKWRMKTFFVIY